ncbi:MAG: hypothetical protein H7838_09255 [Magnetococcus sp. DMHC-8]
MMDDRTILLQMIQDAACIKPEPHYEKHKVILTETQSSESSESSVEILHVPTDTLVIRVDCFPPPDGIFNGNLGECKRADFAIISCEKNLIICIEMKLTKGDLTEIKQQLRGAECFMKYCQAIGKTFWNAPQFLDHCEYRFVAIQQTNVSIPKRPTKITKPASKHNSPDNPMKIDWPHSLTFKQLA